MFYVFLINICCLFYIILSHLNLRDVIILTMEFYCRVTARVFVTAYRYSLLQSGIITMNLCVT